MVTELCELKNYKNGKPNPRIDGCMGNLIRLLKVHNIKTLACCCGHGRYQPSIILKEDNGEIFDLMSGQTIPRKTKFYKRDKQGYYYIPEVNKDG